MESTVQPAADAYPYRNPDSLAKWTRWSLYAQTVISIVAVLGGIQAAKMLNRLDDGTYASEEEAGRAAAATDLLQGIVALLQFSIIVWCGVMILRWIHRANWNARALGAENLQFTPGWSVGWYFIPFMNLWRPYMAMKEIWRATSYPTSWRKIPVPIPHTLGLWWLLWIASTLTGNASFRMSMREETLDDMLQTNFVTMASDIFTAPLCIVFLLLLNQLQRKQDAWAVNAGLRPDR